VGNGAHHILGQCLFVNRVASLSPCRSEPTAAAAAAPARRCAACVVIDVLPRLIRHVGSPESRPCHRRSRRSVPAHHTGLTDCRIGSEQDSEHEGVRHEEKRHEYGGDEVRRNLQARCVPYAQAIALIKRVEQIDGADAVEPHTMMAPSRLLSVANASSASRDVARSPYAAGRAKASGKSGDTTPGTRNANPTKRKACSRSSGRSATVRGLLRSAGQMYRAPIRPHTTMPRSTLTPKITCGCIIGSPHVQRLDEAPTCHRAAATAKSREGRTRAARGMPARAPEGSA
jgi:hypothetical protein